MPRSRLFLAGLVGVVVLGLLYGGGDVWAKSRNRRSAEGVRTFSSNTSDLPPTQFGGLFVSAQVDTYILGTWGFDTNGVPDPQGWTSHDRGAQVATYFHVDDFAGLNGGDYGRLTPLDGQKSMWCGVRPSVSSDPWCSWACLPGYGNSWDQRFESVMFPVSGDVTVSYDVRWDSEPGYDQTVLQYWDEGSQWWDTLPVDGGIGKYEGVGELSETLVIDSASVATGLKLRFKFTSDPGWSDEDCLWSTDGAILIDNLTITDAGGMVDYQDFETEAVGATATSDANWQGTVGPSLGDYAGLFSGALLRQEDPCVKNLSFLWAFIEGSTTPYCGYCPDAKVGTMSSGYDSTQAAVPAGQYFSPDYSDWAVISNDIWSPPVDWDQDMWGGTIPGSASSAVLELDIYRDFPFCQQLFFRWLVRSKVGTCWGPWQSQVGLYYGDQKDWYRVRTDMTPYVDPLAEQIQVALNVVDMCPFWCNYPPINLCHRHAPLIDNVRVVRVDSGGPVWVVDDTHLFQDNFAGDGTTTGTVRVDMALDLMWPTQPISRPGDSTVVMVDEPNVGLGTDPGGGPAVYIHVKDVSPVKTGTAISGDLGRWPVVSSAGGWTVLRMDEALDSGGSPVDDTYCVDLNDDLYTPGDTIWFYFSAKDASGQTTYWSRLTGTAHSEAVVLASPMEMTCLPANALTGATDILYVDNYDQQGAQPYFDDAFRTMGITPDRYDVRDPSAHEGNGPATRVVDVAAQISAVYKKIIWNSGTLRSGTLGDGEYPDKNDDFGLLFEFLDQREGPAGVYISGDNVAMEWVNQTGANAIAFRSTYMNFNLIADDHTTLGQPVSPPVVGQPGTLFEHGGVPDSLIAFGGCPELNRFDVLGATGSSVTAAAYSDVASDGAVLTQSTVNQADSIARVVLSGFSFHFISDDRVQLPQDRAEHLLDILRWLDNDLPGATGVPAAAEFANSLAQNYPNPFNPVTTIRYSIRERGHVSLRVYNVAGQHVRTLVSEVQTPRAGGYSVKWDGRNDAGQAVSSGVYFYRVRTADFVRTRKMVIIK